MQYIDHEGIRRDDGGQAAVITSRSLQMTPKFAA